MTKFYELNGTKFRLKSITAVSAVQEVYTDRDKPQQWGFDLWLSGPDPWTISYSDPTAGKSRHKDEASENAKCHAIAQHAALMGALEDALD